ncbi:DJ-1/PfpI family protein [Algibacter sp. PT7-4]|uniref:DJ-1/PfpI family protein n=1 Tax=Algibacter ulvanivorans TaxID=3400999 RepID=UPI003AAA6DA4
MRKIKRTLSLLLFITALLLSCNLEKSKPKLEQQNELISKNTPNADIKHIKPFNKALPTIGLLMYNGVLQSEIIATSDVFSKPDAVNGKPLFNVITIAETENYIVTEEGMKFIPDYTFKNCPKLDALFIPSAYNMYAQVNNNNIVNFIREKNNETTYTISNCAGANLIGESGIAKGHKIVTWIGGGEELQKNYPDLLVQNDSLVTYVKDGKFLSSNGNLASYIPALNLLEILTSKAQREFVESYLYLNRLQNWKK